MKLYKLLPSLLLIPALVLAGQGYRNVAISYTTALTGAGPSGNPAVQPLDPAGVQSCWQGDAGPAGCVPGAIHLSGINGYRITYCLTNGTLNAAGKELISYCPESNSSVCNGLWPLDPGLTETVTVTGTSCPQTDAGTAGCSCQTFMDHASSGMPAGWMVVTPSGMTSSDGGTTGTTIIELRTQT